MDIRTLRYFLAVSREENITRAAEFLHISQPSLSNQMIELEKEIGKPLLIRGKRKVTLTQTGILLRKRAEELVALMEKTERELTANPETVAGDVSIGSGDTEATQLAIQAAKRLSKKHPAICYHLFSGDAEAVIERLDDGLLDFGILIEPIDHTKYESIHLPIQDTWGILMRSDDPLSCFSELSFEDLVDLPLIVPQRAGLQQMLSHWAGRDFRNLNFSATYNLTHNAVLLVKADMGYALMLDQLVDTGEGTGLTFCPLTPSITVHLSMVWKKHQVFSQAAEQFINALQEQLSESKIK